ncbi:MAG: HmuY family protein [Bacteroidetes bacterium]|nr:HmuY family protein [Bacteroidota bacterium]
MIRKRIHIISTSARMLSLSLLLLACLGISSCFKEKPIPMPKIYNGPDVFTAHIGPGYIKQLYFNAQTYHFVDSNSHYLYDMAFDCAPGSYNVYINGSKLMFACHTGKYNLRDVTSLDDTLSNGWKEEFGSGLPAQRAIGDWGVNGVSAGEVYLLNMGTDSLGYNIGFKKMQMGDCTGNDYLVTFCNLDGSDMHKVSVPRMSGRNKVYLLFADQQVRDLEPDNTNWDMLFTRYSIYFADQNLPYLVTGVLTNPNKSAAYFVDSTSNFDSLTLNNVEPSRFTAALDNIGYEWKLYGLGTSGRYTIKPSFIYILRSGSRYYKLRFIGSFYDKDGNEGYPEFQIDELK